MKRRDFLKLGVLGGATGLGFLSAKASLSSGTAGNSSTTGFTTGTLEITELVIPLPTHLHHFDQLTIAFITDIHHGIAMNPTWILNLKEVVNKQKVDLILLGGDYIWAPEASLTKALTPNRNPLFQDLTGEDLNRAIYSDLFQTLSQFHAHHGIFGVRGNHDCWHSPTECKSLFATHVGELLVNQRTDIEITGYGTVEVAGADDYWVGMPQPPKFSSRRDRLQIFLTHNPDHLIEECQGAIPADALVLCGHTHGGQIALPTIGPLTYNIRSPEYGYGLKAIDDFSLFTSRGIGVVELPFRYNCPQEVVFIRFSGNPRAAPSKGEAIDKSV
ncbi:MAG: metallophosphoesterase [Bdellovibrionota bacterium]